MALPMATVATGIPAGICTIEYSESTPERALLLTGTPITGRVVIGVPVSSKALSGVDSLYSIVQMPAGIPVATVAIGNAANAALLAVQILALGNGELRRQLHDYRRELEQMVAAKDERLQQLGSSNYLAQQA